MNFLFQIRRVLFNFRLVVVPHLYCIDVPSSLTFTSSLLEALQEIVLQGDDLQEQVAGKIGHSYYGQEGTNHGKSAKGEQLTILLIVERIFYECPKANQTFTSGKSQEQSDEVTND